MDQRSHTSLRRYRFRVSGARAEDGQDIELTIDAMDEGDACRRANQQGIYVAACRQVMDEALRPMPSSPVYSPVAAMR